MAFFVTNAACVDRPPNDRAKTCIGTKMHVTGAPMAGYGHEFQRNVESATRLTGMDPKYVVDPQSPEVLIDQVAPRNGMLDDIAFRVPAPSLTTDFLNPANAVR